MGTVISLPVSGLLAEFYGWPSIFYVFGIVGLIWTLIWMLCVSEDPNNDKWITDDEMDYINCSRGSPSPTVRIYLYTVDFNLTYEYKLWLVGILLYEMFPVTSENYLGKQC